jgi:hypothetical protein
MSPRRTAFHDNGMLTGSSGRCDFYRRLLFDWNDIRICVIHVVDATLLYIRLVALAVRASTLRRVRGPSEWNCFLCLVFYRVLAIILTIL